MTKKYAHIWDIEGAVEPSLAPSACSTRPFAQTCPPLAPSSTARTASASRGELCPSSRATAQRHWPSASNGHGLLWQVPCDERPVLTPTRDTCATFAERLQ